MSIIELLKIEFMKVKKVYDFTFAFNPTYFSCGFWCFQYQYVYDTRIYKCLVSNVYSKCIAFWLLFTSVFNGSCMRYDC